MTRIAIRIEHKNLPLTRSNILDAQMSSEGIRDAAERFQHELSVIAGDDTLTVVKSAKSIIDRETIYFISSSLGRSALVAAIEKTMSGLKLGGSILESTDEVKVGPLDDRLIDPKI
jgi:hypothetical protein